MTPTAVVNARGRARIAAGHCWVFRQDVVRGPDQDAGSGGPSLVLVTDERRRPLALATWAARARLALRVLERGENDQLPLLASVIEARLAAAVERRRALRLDRDAFRAVHGESDGLPGLFVDCYADAAVIQTTSVAMDAARREIVELVRARLQPRLVVVRDDGSAREFEGLARWKGIVAGEGSSMVVYRLGENRLEADLMEDSKTGGFLDQADNHALVAAAARPGARCLDAFSYHGGFALALARLGGPVLATDEDERAVGRAAANAARNGLGKMEARRANAFDLLRTLESEGQRFDVVVLDPPAFAKRKGSGARPAEAADRAYREVILRGLRLATPGGLVVACSCSGAVTRAHFDTLVDEAAADSGRLVQVVARHGAGRDHPERVGVPETGHLKCWLLRVL
jgi:23S rRNA (cytosine1962-C5)-methyltransferase